MSSFPSRPGLKTTPNAEDAKPAPTVEAGKRVEELRRRRGENESEEFEKMKQKQQEAAVELEELKKKREERRKILEEEEQRRKKDEADRKAREEVTARQSGSKDHSDGLGALRAVWETVACVAVFVCLLVSQAKSIKSANNPS